MVAISSRSSQIWPNLGSLPCSHCRRQSIRNCCSHGGIILLVGWTLSYNFQNALFSRPRLFFPHSCHSLCVSQHQSISDGECARLFFPQHSNGLSRRVALAMVAAGIAVGLNKNHFDRVIGHDFCNSFSPMRSNSIRLVVGKFSIQRESPLRTFCSHI